MDLLNTPLNSTPLRTVVPNLFPTLDAAYRIAIVGEAPGRDEEACGQPFVGASGRLLNALLSSAGLVRQALFLGNVCQHRPPSNDISEFAWDSEKIQHGLTQLRADLLAFRPNLVVLLGNTPLKAFFGKTGITDWRGSVLRSIEFGYKCMPTYHPAAILRQYDWLQILALDLRRAAEEGRHDRVELPDRLLILPEHEHYIDSVLTSLIVIRQANIPVSLDIEGGVTGMSCLSLATGPDDSFIIPFSKTDGISFWSEEDEEQIWVHLSALLADENVPKILQNSLYDNFVLSYTYHCPIVNVADDTMLKHWEAYCELPKGLAFQASIYTKQPPWKDDRTTPDLKTFWRYCCTDSAVTYEINTRLTAELADSHSSLLHYRFNLALLHPILYMELRGIRYDKPLATTRKAEIDDEVETLNLKLEVIAGRPVNVNSSKQFQHYLYDELGLPEVRNRKTGKRTTNYEALLSLAKKTDHPVLHIAIKLRSLRTHSSMLAINADGDGRIRCGYNVVGTETGRLTCYTSPTGSGYNLQTIPEHDRDLFLADPGHYMFQCDLSGADAWTVAAHCARLGDTTMLDDLRYGIKIAKVVAGMFLHGPEISRLDREALHTLTETIAKHEPIYFGSKCCQHGTNYGMGKVLLSQTIFIQSEGKVNISAADAERLQNLYLLRYYGVRLWHRWAEQTLKTIGRLTSASGHTRIFFGRRDDHTTIKQFLAHEPQANTTYATNMAALQLWTDPTNRWGYWQCPPSGPADANEPLGLLIDTARDKHPSALIIEPLHQVHDAIVGQFPQELSGWAAGKIKSYFANPLVIAGQTLTIPFDGGYGESWGNLKKGKI